MTNDSIVRSIVCDGTIEGLMLKMHIGLYTPFRTLYTARPQLSDEAPFDLPAGGNLAEKRAHYLVTQQGPATTRSFARRGTREKSSSAARVTSCRPAEASVGAESGSAGGKRNVVRTGPRWAAAWMTRAAEPTNRWALNWLLQSAGTAR